MQYIMGLFSICLLILCAQFLTQGLLLVNLDPLFTNSRARNFLVNSQTSFSHGAVANLVIFLCWLVFCQLDTARVIREEGPSAGRGPIRLTCGAFSRLMLMWEGPSHCGWCFCWVDASGKKTEQASLNSQLQFLTSGSCLEC